ncbi:hypothetical protein [Dankookia sp. GCM10030260]|uniref:hypothetical protein n=1 Tax=Dankookia sp. GCM10030260 TaxID=3273390 RepID=UPI0036D2BB1D
MTLLNVPVTVAVTAIVNGYFEGTRDQEKRVEKSIDAFRNEAAKLDALMMRYTTAVLEEAKDKNSARRELMENLIKQRQLLEDAARILPGGINEQTKSYEKALEALNREIPRAETTLAMKEFWKLATELALARLELSRRFEKLGV